MSGKVRILVVDDEPQIRRFLRHALDASGFEPVFAETAAEALLSVKRTKPAAVVLDLGLPDLDGKLVIGQIRQTSAVPIIVLSARDQEAEKIAAFDLGANDYVVKPFGIGEFLARLRAVLRSSQPETSGNALLASGPISINPDRHEAMKNGAPVRLTPKEFELLSLLVRHAGRVMTHSHILETVWGPAHREDIAYLRVFVGQLRHKIEDTPSEPVLILTEPGIGYRFADGG